MVYISVIITHITYSNLQFFFHLESTGEFDTLLAEGPNLLNEKDPKLYQTKPPQLDKVENIVNECMLNL